MQFQIGLNLPLLTAEFHKLLVFLKGRPTSKYNFSSDTLMKCIMVLEGCDVIDHKASDFGAPACTSCGKCGDENDEE